MRELKKIIIGILVMFFMMPIVAVIAQTVDPTVITNPPVDTGEFVQWLFSSIKNLSGASSTLIIAFVLSAIIGVFKLTPLSKYWDKLGKWKFIVPLALGATVEILMHLPKPFSWTAFISQLIAGASGTGTVAIAVREIWRQFFPKKTPA